MSDVLEELKRVSCCVFKDGWTSPDLHARVGIELAVLRGRVAEIEALRRENQELRAGRDEWEALATEFKGLTEEWQARADALEAENQELRKAVIEECAKVADEITSRLVPDELPEGVAKAIAHQIRALTMSDIHREQLDRPRREAE